MVTYQLTINDDFSSTLVFGSTAPDNLDGVLGTVEDDAEEALEPTDGPSVEAGSFVSTKQVKLPNYNFLDGKDPVFRFVDNEMVESFVKGNLTILKQISKNALSVDAAATAMDLEFPEVITLRADIVRNQRNTLLMESDWTQAADSPLSDDDKAAWATYRTDLRNLSDHANWPELLPEDWPTKP